MVTIQTACVRTIEWACATDLSVTGPSCYCFKFPRAGTERRGPYYELTTGWLETEFSDSLSGQTVYSRSPAVDAADSSDSRLPLCAKVPSISAESRQAACSGDLFRCIFLDEKWQTIQKG